MKMFFMTTAMMISCCCFYSCSEDDSFGSSSNDLTQNYSYNDTEIESRSDRHDVNDESDIVLGEKRNNPFTINNINKANNLLYGRNTIPKKATHKYLKFLPTTTEHLDIL